MSQSTIEQHKEQVIDWVHEGKNNTEIASELSRRGVPTTRHSVRRFKSKLGLDKGAEKQVTKFSPFEATVLSDAGVDISDADKIVADQGFDPEEWEYKDVTVNYWDSPTGETLKQLKVHMTAKNPVTPVVPARTDGPKWEKPTPRPIPEEGSTIVVGGDDQAPYHDPVLAEKKLLLLEAIKPHKLIKIGDTNDLPSISRYKTNPELELEAQVNDCVDAGYELMRDERIACGPETEIYKIIGNHDVRLREFVIANTPQLHGLRRAMKDGKVEPSVFSPEFLLRLDELGVELVGEHENYEHGEVKISKYLAARHGWIATKGSGSSALKTLEQLLYSVLVGHTHRLSLVHKTIHNIDGDLTVLAAAETGCLCTVNKKGLGFTPSPDWQQGLVVADVFPDGKFHIEVVPFIGGNLYWRGNRY